MAVPSFEELARIGRAAGLCAVGICDAEPFTEVRSTIEERKSRGLNGGMQFTYRNPQRSTDPSRTVRRAKRLIVGALEFDGSTPQNPHPATPHAVVAAYARDDYYRALRLALDAIAKPLRDVGHRATVVADDNALVDRAAAQRAGLGWWGKNSNILIGGIGSSVVLGSVITDAEIAHPDSRPARDGCGTCRRCLSGCPTGALVEPGVLDARKCLAWLLQQDGVIDPDYRVALGNRIYGCDDCSQVCPPNRTRVRVLNRQRRQPLPLEPEARRQHPRLDTAVVRSPGPLNQSEVSPQPAQRNNEHRGAWVDVLEMLRASDSDLLERFGRWYIPKRQARYLRRNALIVLANTADPADPRVAHTVDRALAHPDEIVRAHAVWCARRLGLSLTALAGRDDPLVQAELARAVEARTPAPRR